ncbi:hypothetical Protein pso3_07690 [Candidatus Phytoplasma solani]
MAITLAFLKDDLEELNIFFKKLNIMILIPFFYFFSFNLNIFQN